MGDRLSGHPLLLMRRTDILSHHWRAKVLAAVLLFSSCALDGTSVVAPEDVVISRHAFQGTFIGFEIGDYVHPVVRDGKGKRRSFFVADHGLSYYLALHEGKPLQLEYVVVDSYIEQAGGTLRIDRLVAATDGHLGSREWWWNQERTRTREQLITQYEPLIDKYTISQYDTDTPFALNTVRGSWHITGKSFCPHICAMDLKEAKEFTGVRLTYSTALFSNGRASCASPRYSRRGWTKESFLTEYRFNPEMVGLKRSVIEEILVQCKDRLVSWPVVGATVFVKDERTLLVAWDGVFFEAQRQ